MPRKKKIPIGVYKAVRDGAVKGEIDQPDLGRFLSAFFRQAGGEEAVAVMMYDEFVNAKPGSIVRQRILDMILRSTRTLQADTLDMDDLGVLSEEDLQRELDRILTREEETREQITRKSPRSSREEEDDGEGSQGEASEEAG